MPLIHGLTKQELSAVCADLEVPAYRADQIWRWLYIQAAPDWTAMKNLPAPFRDRLAARYSMDAARALETVGPPAGTRKLLVGLPDGESVEEVLILAGGTGGRPRRTVCVSSQVGCRFLCAFCASGQAGFRRNLEPGEIVGQVLLAMREFEQRPTNVVFMGIGEPLDNTEAVLKAVRILNDKEGLNIAARKITISTCGLIPGMERLAAEPIQFELSVSLHAPEDALRSALMPVNRRYPLAELIRACAAYTAKTRRIITFEYTLIRGVNDSTRHATALAALVRGMLCRINLIPLSQVEEFNQQPAPAGTAEAFAKTLEQAGINTTLRVSKGSSLKAACGQLRFAGRDNGADARDQRAPSTTGLDKHGAGGNERQGS